MHIRKISVFVAAVSSLVPTEFANTQRYSRMAAPTLSLAASLHGHLPHGGQNDITSVLRRAVALNAALTEFESALLP